MKDAWDGAKAWVGIVAAPSAWAWLKDGPPAVFHMDKGAWNGALQWISVAVPSAWAWLSSGPAAPVFGWVKTQWAAALGEIGTAKEIAAWVAGLFKNAATAIANVEWGDLGKTIGGAIRDGIIAAAKTFAALITPFFEDAATGGIVDVMIAVVKGMGSLLLTAAKAALDFVLGFIDGLFKTDLQAKFTAAWDAVATMLKEYSLYDIGKALVETLGDGLVAVKDVIKEKIKIALGWLGDYLPDSDAKKGPLSRLTESGKAIIETLAEGVRQAQPLRAALTAGALALPPTADLLAPLPVGPPAVQAAAVGGQGGTTTIAINFAQGAIVIEGAGGDPREIAAALGGEVLRETMRALAEEIDSVVES